MSESETWIDPYEARKLPNFRNPNGYPVVTRRRPVAAVVTSLNGVPERFAGLLQPGEVPARLVTRVAYFNFRLVRRGPRIWEAVATRARDYNEEVFGAYLTQVQARRALTRAHRTFGALREAI